MKRNFDAPMTDLLGNPYADSATLKTVCLLAFQSPAKGDDSLSGQEKLAQYVLASKVVKGGVVDITAEDITLLKDRLAKTIQTLAYGKAVELLESDYIEVFDTEKESATQAS
jgi:hypothetical protein